MMVNLGPEKEQILMKWPHMQLSLCKSNAENSMTHMHTECDI